MYRPKNTAADIAVQIKNFGQTPAFDFEASWKGLVNDKEIGGHDKVPDKPQTLNPGDTRTLHGETDQYETEMIAKGSDVLEIEVTLTYTGMDEIKYKTCSRERYVPSINSSQFMDLGPTCSH
jgi:hypothetical protein